MKRALTQIVLLLIAIVWSHLGSEALNPELAKLSHRNYFCPASFHP